MDGTTATKLDAVKPQDFSKNRCLSIQSIMDDSRTNLIVRSILAERLKKEKAANKAEKKEEMISSSDGNNTTTTTTSADSNTSTEPLNNNNNNNNNAKDKLTSRNSCSRRPINEKRRLRKRNYESKQMMCVESLMTNIKRKMINSSPPVSPELTKVVETKKFESNTITGCQHQECAAMHVQYTLHDPATMVHVLENKDSSKLGDLEEKLNYY